MEKMVKIILFESVAGRDFAYGKGENDVPESLARELIRAGHAQPSDTATLPYQKTEKATSNAAQTSEKR